MPVIDSDEDETLTTMNSFINDSDVNKVVYDDANNRKFLNGYDKYDNKFNGSNVIEEDVMILMVSMKMST